MVADRDGEQPASEAQAGDTFDFVRNSVASLPDRQRLILNLRFGIDGAREHTLTEIGHLLGVSAERIRQLQKQAFENLRDGPVGEELLQLSLD